MEQEKVEYLIIDMEWNQKAGTHDVINREPIQIGLIGADKNLDKRKLFSKNIRLDDVSTLTQETCKMTHTNAKAVMQAKSKGEVFKCVKESFPVFKYVVVWTRGTYDLFVQSMEREGIKIPRHRVVVLQDILNLIAMKQGTNIGFETALIRAKIPYQKEFLHYSKHDVQYMYELLKKVYMDYHRLTEKEGCISNKTSKIIHAPECRYVRYANNDSGADEKVLIFRGYRSCSCCGSEENWRRIYWSPQSKTTRNKKNKIDFRKLPLTDNNIELICSQFDIKCNISESIVFLTTNCSYWRLYLDGENVERVLHSNHWIKAQEFKKKKKCNEGFHKQNISMTNFYDVVQYIYYHDKGIYSNRKKSKMELLFEQIQKEKTCE